MPHITPDKIGQIAFGFASSKALLSAVELGLFTELAKSPGDAASLTAKLGLNERAARDFFDTLVALGMLDRKGGFYSNTPEADLYLDRAKPTYMGGLLEMMNARLYAFWGSLTEALRTGKPQNEIKAGGNAFEVLYSNPERLEAFLKAMTGISLGTGRAIAEKFPWDNYKTFVDVGCAQGALPVQVALKHGHLTGLGYDLECVGPIYERYIRTNGLSDRLKFAPGDFFKDPLPKTDVLVMGHILHDWNLEEKKMLLKKAYDALQPGGAVLIYEAIIDDERRNNVFGLIMSLNMLIETTGGFDYTGAECCQWMREAGFRETRVEHLIGPDSMVIGIK
ncbi:methyltransferase [Pedosphaera parvula]|nr:methyltransferase [Pedosphaera parvula]